MHKNQVGRPVTKKRQPKPEFLEMPVQPGESIGEVCRRAVRLANQKHTVIQFVFQGMVLEAREDDDEWEIGNKWFATQKKGAA